jgi:hypothetical protein
MAMVIDCLRVRRLRLSSSSVTHVHSDTRATHILRRKKTTTLKVGFLLQHVKIILWPELGRI